MFGTRTGTRTKFRNFNIWKIIEGLAIGEVLATLGAVSVTRARRDTLWGSPLLAKAARSGAPGGLVCACHVGDDFEVAEGVVAGVGRGAEG